MHTQKIHLLGYQEKVLITIKSDDDRDKMTAFVDHARIPYSMIADVPQLGARAGDVILPEDNPHLYYFLSKPVMKAEMFE